MERFDFFLKSQVLLPFRSNVFNRNFAVVCFRFKVKVEHSFKAVQRVTCGFFVPTQERLRGRHQVVSDVIRFAVVRSVHTQCLHDVTRFVFVFVDVDDVIFKLLDQVLALDRTTVR